MSYWSNLKIELMDAGSNDTTWGNVTNNNWYAIDAAISGTATVDFNNADRTLQLTDSNGSQEARYMRLNLTGITSGTPAGYNLIFSTGANISKVYIIRNASDGIITVKNTTGTGIAVPSGKTMWVYNNGTNVVDVTTHLTSLTLGSPLPVTSGGTGTNAVTFCNLTTNVVGKLPVANGGTGGDTQATARSGIGAAAAGANTDITSLSPTGGLQVGAPTGGAKGDGTLNAAGLFINGTAVGTGSGSVTLVNGTGTVNGITLSGSVSTSGNLTLSGDITSVNASATIGGVLIGYRNIPRSTTTTTANISDVGKCISATANITIPNAVFSAGDSISIFNNSASSINVASGSGLTMYLAGTATVGTRTLSQRGIATIWFETTSIAVISGGGLA